MTIPVTLPPAYFDAMYQAAADPWGFEDRWYEQRKYAVLGPPMGTRTPRLQQPAADPG